MDILQVKPLETELKSPPLPMDTVNVLGIQVACIRKKQLLHQVTAWSADENRRNILYVNAHCMNVAHGDPEHQRILNDADIVYSDGIGVVWAGHLAGGSPMEKITGRDWIADFCVIAADQALRLYILAGRPGVAKKAQQNLQRKWPDLQIVGAYDGYFVEQSEAAILADLARTRPHVLLVGMNTPQQEKWIAQHREDIPVPVCWATGALFDYVAGREPPVPGWMNALALEWLWRLLVDPTGKWRRYLIGNPLFILRVLQQWLNGTTKKGE